MSAKRGRPTNRALAERERRARARSEKAKKEAAAADVALGKAAEWAVARKSMPDAIHAHGLLQKAAYRWVDANEAAWAAGFH